MLGHHTGEKQRPPFIAGIVLAGGQSSRMGTDKAMLDIGGMPSISRAAGALRGVAAQVVIACGEKEREEYRFLNLPQAPDLFPGCGPLAGIHAGMMHSPAEWYAAVACDLPFVTADFLRCMIARAAEDTAAGSDAPQAVLPVSAEGRLQPLLGLYRRDALPFLEEALAAGRFKVMDWLRNLDVRQVPESLCSGVRRDHPSPLLNMNTPEDYRKAGDFRV